MKNDGGKAFPSGEIYEERRGMSLRDYFAAKAMIGLLLRFETSKDIEQIAESAYVISDAMLTERAKHD